MKPAFALPLFALVLAAAIAAGCASSDGESTPDVIVVPLGSPTARATIATGGKPAAPPVTSTATTEATVTAAPVESLAAAATEAPAVEPTATLAPVGPPSSGRWIDVDVTSFVVRLMDGDAVVHEIGPVGVGVQVDTGEYLSTQTGLFAVNGKVADLVYDAPFDTYISHWVGFDADKDNGFHSFLKDAQGGVVDASTGRVSNGCIRTGEPEAVFDFAEIGMPVWVHH